MNNGTASDGSVGTDDVGVGDNGDVGDVAGDVDDVAATMKVYLLLAAMMMMMMMAAVSSVMLTAMSGDVDAEIGARFTPVLRHRSSGVRANLHQGHPPEHPGSPRYQCTLL